VSPSIRHPLLLCPLDQRPFRTLTEFWVHCQRHHRDRLDQEGNQLCVEKLQRMHERRVVNDSRLRIVPKRA
jgi:hypothetical protein